MRVLKFVLESDFRRYVMLLCYVIDFIYCILLYRDAQGNYKSYETRKGVF